jgi:hypothetical protein
MTYGCFIPDGPKVAVIVTTKHDVFDEFCGSRNHIWERSALQNLGALQRKKGERSFKLWVTEEELSRLRNPEFRWPQPIKPSTGNFIESVELDNNAHLWQCREDGEYLVENGLTFRLRNITKYDTYTNYYTELHLLTVKGWTKLQSVYSGNTYHGANDGRRQSYDRVRRHAETLVELGASIAQSIPAGADESVQ